MKQLSEIVCKESFHKERELLLKEIASLKKSKLDLEEKLVERNVEVTKLKDLLSKQQYESHESLSQFAKVESQVDSFRKDNIHLRAELNDARIQLISRDNLIKDLQQQLADKSFKVRSSEAKVNLKII